MGAARLLRSVHRPLRRVGEAVRQILGAPDYDRYLRERAGQCGGTPALTRTAFLAAALARRYDRPGSRCC